jgi:uncharacterized protein (DUF2235 family)
MVVNEPHRNLVLCADGTCNAFGHSHSNVARLLQCAELDKPDIQAVCYDQGIGTSRGEYARIRATLGHLPALDLLPPPDDTWWRPMKWLSKIRSMAFGYGLETNVRQLYEKVAELYEGNDRVFLFGFSRGAFTVRALAGLMWRYGIPSEANRDQAGRLFDEVWPMFLREYPDERGEQAAKAGRVFARLGQRDCPIHFLGLWDTVKSYGGLDPLVLPHLRHNPRVTTVRHALALDERRGWFELTTWGWVDRDRECDAASFRLSEADRQKIAKQDTLEVWFSGCHSDVGGGALRNGKIDDTAEIALRWMLGEAVREGLQLNDHGRCVLSVPRAAECPRARESRGLSWKVVELKRRRAINNEGHWPLTFPAPRGASPRQPLHSIRDKTIWRHESVMDASRFGPLPTGVELKIHTTKRITSAPRETACQRM